MTIEELLARESIRCTMEKYTMSGDDFDEDRFVSCFTDDAVLEFDPFPDKGHVRLEGRPAIREFVSEFFGPMKSGAITLPAGVVRHHLTSGEIEFVGSETAAARNYCLAVNSEGVQASGLYTSTFRKEGDQWLIVHRKWSVD